jgi:hypothetical protein
LGVKPNKLDIAAGDASAHSGSKKTCKVSKGSEAVGELGRAIGKAQGHQFGASSQGIAPNTSNGVSRHIECLIRDSESYEDLGESGRASGTAKNHPVGAN